VDDVGRDPVRQMWLLRMWSWGEGRETRGLGKTFAGRGVGAREVDRMARDTLGDFPHGE